MIVSNLTPKHAALFLQLIFKGTIPAMGKLNRCFFFVLYWLLIQRKIVNDVCLNAQKYNFGVNVNMEDTHRYLNFKRAFVRKAADSTFSKTLLALAMCS